MAQLRDNPFEGQLNVIATLSGRVIEARVDELRRDDELTMALRQMHKHGATLDELSEACGLTTAEIQRRMDSELLIESDLDALAGLR